jgi:bifunctional DNA-binding transcriptional regulator/antitoxin component of YhaV-PrlF toxin-antitoxin module
MIITVKDKMDLVVPPSVQREAGIRAGDRLEFKVSGGVINIIPKRLTPDDEYTPEQRRVINAQLAEGLEDIRAGRVSPRFNTVDEMLASLKSGRKAARRRKTRSR